MNIPTYKDMHPEDAFLLLIGRKFTVSDMWDADNTVYTINAPDKNRSLNHETSITYMEKGVEEVNTGYSRELVHKLISNGDWKLIKRD